MLLFLFSFLSVCVGATFRFDRKSKETLSFREQSIPGMLYYNSNMLRVDPQSVNLAVIGTCKKMVLASADADVYGSELGSTASLLNNLLLKLLKSLKDKSSVESALKSYICRSALQSFPLSPEVVQLLAQVIPTAVETEWLSEIRDFSFLTPDSAVDLFMFNKNVRKPFRYQHFGALLLKMLSLFCSKNSFSNLIHLPSWLVA